MWRVFPIYFVITVFFKWCPWSWSWNSSTSINGTNILFQDYLFNWFHPKVKYKNLPLLIICALWKTNDYCIFEDIKPSSCLVSIRVLGACNEFPSFKLPLKQRTINFLDIIEDIPTCFLDGETKDGFYGVGMILNIKKEHHIRIRMAIGEGSNTKVEFLSLCCLLWFSYKRGVLKSKPLETLRLSLTGLMVLLRCKLYTWNTRWPISIF